MLLFNLEDILIFKKYLAFALKLQVSICILIFFSACSQIGVDNFGGLSNFGGFGSSEGVPAKPIYHIISKGESLLGISGRYQATPDEILMLNGLQTTKHFRVGQKLLVGYQYPEDLNKIERVNAVYTSNQKPEIKQTAVYNHSHDNKQTNSGNKEVMYKNGRILWPLEKSARIVSGFGPRWGTFHDGLDFAAPVGTKVLSAHNGIVAYAGSDLGGYGKLLVVKGDDGLITVYAHNSRLLVSQGDKVSRGEVIAEVGATGKAEGPHLHFEVRTRDKRGKAVAVDPLPLIKPSDDNERPRFRINDSLKPLLAWLE